MGKRIFAAGVVLLPLLIGGRSEATLQTLRVFGAGNQSCGVWLQHTVNTDPRHLTLASWVDGYLSARNEALSVAGKPGDLGHASDNDSRDAWITKYCQSHPLDILFVPAKALVDELAATGR